MNDLVFISGSTIVQDNLYDTRVELGWDGIRKTWTGQVKDSSVKEKDRDCEAPVLYR